MFSASEEQLLANAGYAMEELVDSNFNGKGSFEDLSDSPELLKSLIASSKKIKYDEKKSKIKLSSDLSAQDLMSLNALLKKPIYSTKPMSVQKMKETQSEMIEY